MDLGIKVKENANEVNITRTTKETKISVVVNTLKEKSLYVETTIPFLGHMIETIAYRANLNIGLLIDFKIKLDHTISEDIGIALGRAILELFKIKMSDGIEGFGYARGVLDEAYADAIISIEGRANCFINGPEFQNIDGIYGYSLVAFLEGFCQGCKCTLKLDFSGRDPHHSWEAVFRALGYAIKNVFKKNIWRKGTISALKGTLD
jgi:imidazoleglycerol phosphate dehydratase HisB